MFNGNSQFTPVIVKIKGYPADVDFLNFCLLEILVGCQVRTLRDGLKRVKFVDGEGCNEITMFSPASLRHVTIMAKQLGVEIVAVALGSIPVDLRPLTKGEFTVLITRDERSETFDFSVR